MTLRELIEEYVQDSYKPEFREGQLAQFLSRLEDSVLDTVMEDEPSHVGEPVGLGPFECPGCYSEHNEHVFTCPLAD